MFIMYEFCGRVRYGPGRAQGHGPESSREEDRRAPDPGAVLPVRAQPALPGAHQQRGESHILSEFPCCPQNDHTLHHIYYVRINTKQPINCLLT